MKEATVDYDLNVRVSEVPVPEPQAGQVLIEVVVAGANPKDWKVPLWMKEGRFPGGDYNPCDDAAGIVAKVGPGVTEFKPGDRVAAFHTILRPHGTLAEYTVAEEIATFHIPESLSFEDAVTIPLAAMTAFLVLYRHLGLPQPWTKAGDESIPLVIYGGATAIGAFAIQFARLSNIHPIIAVAGKSAAFVENLIDRSKGDTVVDYREGNEALIKNVKAAAGADNLLLHGFDCVSERPSFVNISAILSFGGKLVTVLPFQDYSGISEHIKHYNIDVLGVQDEFPDLCFVCFRYIAKGLKEGWFNPHPYEVLPGGLEAVAEGFARSRAGKANAVKYVYRVAD